MHIYTQTCTCNEMRNRMTDDMCLLHKTVKVAHIQTHVRTHGGHTHTNTWVLQGYLYHVHEGVHALVRSFRASWCVLHTHTHTHTAL